jgi:hypothetical protein
MINLDFKNWFLNEVGTSTSCVAVFSRPLFSSELVTRTWPPQIGEDEPHKKKKKEEDHD